MKPFAVYFALFLSITFARDGDDQLAQAFDKAFAEVSDDLWKDFDKYRVPFVKSEECLVKVISYPETPTGSFKQILSNQKLTIGYLHGYLFKKPFQLATVRAVDKINRHYNVNIYTKFQPKDSLTRLSEYLSQEDVDASSPSLDASPYLFNQTRLKDYIPSCAIAAYTSRLYLNKQSTIKSYKEFLEKFAADNSLKIGVLKDSVELFEDIHPKLVGHSVVVDKESVTNSDISLTSGTVAIFSASILENANEFVIMSTETTVPIRMFFRVHGNEMALPFADPAQFGNAQLRESFDLAISEIQQERDSSDSALIIPFVVNYVDCQSELAKPNPVPKEFTTKMLSKKKIILGYTPGFGKPLFSKDKNGFTGVIPQFEEKILKSVVNRFNSTDNITIERIEFKTTDLLFQALDKGEIDATSSVFIGISGENRYRYESTCSLFAVKPIIWYNPNKQKKTLTAEEIRELIRPPTLNFMIAEDLACASVIESLYPRTKITIEPNSTVAFKKLRDEANCIGFVAKYLDYNIKTDAVSIPTNVSIPVGMFFRRDKETFSASLSNHVGLVILIIVIVLLIIAGIIFLLFFLKKRRNRRYKEMKDGDISNSTASTTSTKPSNSSKRIDSYSPPEIEF